MMVFHSSPLTSLFNTLHRRNWGLSILLLVNKIYMHTFEHTIRILEEDTMHKKQTSPVMLIKQAHHRHLQLLYLSYCTTLWGQGWWWCWYFWTCLPHTPFQRGAFMISTLLPASFNNCPFYFLQHSILFQKPTMLAKQNLKSGLHWGPWLCVTC